MWNRRDVLTMACAAVAGFGMTVGLFWSRSATAVDDKPAAVTNVKVPTLRANGATVTAAMDSEKPHTVLLTVKNTTNEPMKAEFTASANVVGSSSMMSRVGPPSQTVWSEQYSIDLKAGETQVIPVELPEKAFVAAAPAQPKQVSQPQQADTASNVTVNVVTAQPGNNLNVQQGNLNVNGAVAIQQLNAMSPGYSFLQLIATTDGKPTAAIRAVMLSQGTAPQQVATR